MEPRQVVSFTSDGASVMTGHETGRAQRVKQLCGVTLSFHCVAHKLALACADLFKGFEELVDLDKLLQDICGYFKLSPSRKAKLKFVLVELGEKPLAVLKIHL